MANFHVELPGKLSLAQQSKAIEGEEALAARFVGLRLWVNDKNVVTNLVEFEELDSAPEPPLGKPRFSKTLPEGTTPVWVGPLIVQGSALSPVYLLRDAA